MAVPMHAVQSATFGVTRSHWYWKVLMLDFSAQASKRAFSSEAMSEPVTASMPSMAASPPYGVAVSFSILNW